MVVCDRWRRPAAELKPLIPRLPRVLPPVGHVLR
jgi:hypothetical protein